MALRDIVPRRQPRGCIKWGHSQVLYLTYTTGIFKKNNPDSHLFIYYNYHIDSEKVMSHFRIHFRKHFRIPCVLMIIFFLFIGSICVYN